MQCSVPMTRPRGAVILKSTVHGSVAIDTAPVIVNEVTLVGSRCGRFEPAIKLLRTGKVRVASMISEVVPLARAAEAFARAASKGVLKALLKAGVELTQAGAIFRNHQLFHSAAWRVRSGGFTFDGVSAWRVGMHGAHHLPLAEFAGKRPSSPRSWPPVSERAETARTCGRWCAPHRAVCEPAQHFPYRALFW